MNFDQYTEIVNMNNFYNQLLSYILTEKSIETKIVEQITNFVTQIDEYGLIT